MLTNTTPTPSIHLLTWGDLSADNMKVTVGAILGELASWKSRPEGSESAEKFQQRAQQAVITTYGKFLSSLEIQLGN